MQKIFLATKNKKKIEEIKAIFLGLDVQLISILDGIEIPEVVEDKETFEENSAKKALEIAKYLNIVTIADDSGLCVEALNGAPGVYSARFSGENATDKGNNEKLLTEMENIENRKAYFVSVITLAKPDGAIYQYRGELMGEILTESRGHGGFGYDPLFYIHEYDTSLAQMGTEKNAISHRAVALNKLAADLRKILA
ncbi:MAG: XTP/dITP diphosphatase [Fusobacteriaceae bacterium]